MRYLAESFADEFAILGYDETHLIGLFQNPYYGAAHEALRVLGEDAVRGIIRDSLAFWCETPAPRERKRCRK